ncbi:50S ribosomal protein L4 [Skermanella stibiiresistens SB22]|jgi:large subunit ribosomal protein L4|uniref:Large ribosomal subunit protein uL4 n=1 Tax=Skermanella stibiiresistens SB22 TaxID=1385369 RepID=W9H1D6_9PROT|nr:50S ribosomal protein L4 [Skermanella stibiiresistens]EWY39879.1 50S ribosomal protein L4 [Skermanella stibiiresistens SB22]
MKTTVKNLNNEEVGEIELDEAVFGVPLRTDLLARMINYQLAKRRSGNHKTKGISEIAGTTKKPHRQKGTGRARQGSTRSPQFRGGAVIFGPVVRSHAHDLNKKVRKLALKTALSTKLAEGKLVVLETAAVDSHKTKDMALRLKGLGLTSALIIDGANLDLNFVRASRNVPLIDVLPEQGANVYDILRRDTLVLTRNAVEQLEARLK